MAIKALTTKEVTLTGLTPIMFDRYSGDNKTELTVEQKLYLRDKQVVFPSLGIISFLSAQNTESATKRVLPPKEYKRVCAALLSAVSIDPLDVPFIKNGKPILFGAFENEVDKTSGIRIERHVARLPKGIPNPKVRPVLPLPWQLKFKMAIYPSSELNLDLIARIFTEGGALIGLGTYRGVYGKFSFSWV